MLLECEPSDRSRWRSPMFFPGRSRRSLLAAALLAGLASAPAPYAEPAKPAKLVEARYQAALNQYELTWSYFQQARIDSYQVYVWSRLILDSRRDLADKPADRIAALEE